MDRIARNESISRHTNNPLVGSGFDAETACAGARDSSNKLRNAGSSPHVPRLSTVQLLQAAAISIVCSILVHFIANEIASDHVPTDARTAFAAAPSPERVGSESSQPASAQLVAMASEPSASWETQLVAAAINELRLQYTDLDATQTAATRELTEARSFLLAKLDVVREVCVDSSQAQSNALDVLETNSRIGIEALNRSVSELVRLAANETHSNLRRLENLVSRSAEDATKSYSSLLVSVNDLNKTMESSFGVMASLLEAVEVQHLRLSTLANDTVQLRAATISANLSATHASALANVAVQAVEAANINSPLLQGASEQVESLKYMVAELGQHAIIADERDESFLRASGGSGVTSARGTGAGSHPYHTSSWSNFGLSFLAIHDHADLRDTIGMGELEAIMNGVNFKTRHNDYRLKQPSLNSEHMKRTSDVELPAVPPSVLAHGSNVTAQILEMKEYFRAWATQDESIRDYKPYFRPVLSYLEGWWGTDGSFEEPFDSDRHRVAADSWGELYDRVRILEQHGWKDSGENVPWLPSKLWGLKDGVAPQLARWNYRILAVPLKDDVELARFIAEPDLQVQLSFMQPQTREDLFKTRAARFRLNKYIGSSQARIETEAYARWPVYSYLDDLMAQIPGLDNFAPHKPPKDDVVFYSARGNETAYAYGDRSVKLDSRFYNRYFSVSTAGAMGEARRRRGWNDDNLWVASTSQERVAALEGADGRLDRKSYALPLEVIFTTPLTAWNPYNLTIHPDNTYGLPARLGRNGSLTNPRFAYDGVERRNYYLTPVEFYGDLASGSAADTSVTPVGVISAADKGTPREGTVYKVAASGHWIHLPKIPGVAQSVPAHSDRIRQRYPIAPARPTSRTVWQELKALQAVVSDSDSWRVNEGLQPLPSSARYYETGSSVSGGYHSHRFHLTDSDRDMLDGGGTVTRTTHIGNMHQHTLTLALDTAPTADPAAPYKIVQCDSISGSVCAPGHDHGGLHRATL